MVLLDNRAKRLKISGIVHERSNIIYPSLKYFECEYLLYNLKINRYGKDILSLWIERLTIIKMVILSKRFTNLVQSLSKS